MSETLDTLVQFAPGKTIELLYDSLHRTDFVLDHLNDVIEYNPAFLNMMQRFVSSKLSHSKWKAEDSDNPNALPSANKVLHLLGPTGSRNLLLTLRIERKFGRKFNDEKFKLDPELTLKHALIIQTLFENRRMGYASKAFFGGYLFDWLGALIVSSKEGKSKPLENFYEACWNDALMAAKVAYGLGSPLVGFELQSIIFPAALSIGVGRTLMAVCFNDKHKSGGYLAFQEDLKKRAYVSDEMRMLLEQRKFGISHNEIASLTCLFSVFFGEAQSAVNYYLEPYYLKSSSSQIYKLSVLLNVSYYLAKRMHLWKQGTWKILENRHRKRLESIKLGEKELAQAINKAAASD